MSAPSLGIRADNSTEPEQRAEFGVINVTSDMKRENMLQGYIVDPETGKVVAVIRNGEVFRDDKEGAKIATVLNANLYDLSGNLVGRLDGPHAIDVRTWSMPIAVRDLLEGETPHHPVPALKQKGGPKAAPSPTHLERTTPQGVYDIFRGSKPGRSHNDPAH
jgi:hypothetical protein